MYLLNSRGTIRWFALVFVAVFMVTIGVTHNAFAMGQAYGTCPNEYNGTIVSFTINNGSQTFDPMAHPGVTFDVYDNSDYSTSFVIHDASQSFNNNTNPGDAWYESDTPAYAVGICVGNAGPNQNVTATGGGSYPSEYPPGGTITQSVWYDTGNYSDQVTFNVHWIPKPSSSVTSSSTTVPSAPQNLQAGTGNSQVTLSWQAPSSNGGSGVTGYNVYRGTTSGGETLLAKAGNMTLYTDTAVGGGQEYFYKVTAANSAGESPQSNEANATLAAPDPPSGIALDNVQSTSGITDSSNRMTLSSFSAGSGSNQLLVVGISANNHGATSVAFNGQPLTRAVSSFNNNAAQFWYLKNPGGTGNIVTTFGGQTQAVLGAYLLANVDQADPIPTTATNTNSASSSPLVSIATKYANDWVLDLPSIYGSQKLGSPTCTQEWNANIPSAITGSSSSTLVSSPGPVTCKWTASDGGDLWDDVAVEIKSAG